MPTEDLETARPEVAPANMTLTAIRATLNERQELTAVGPSPTASPTEIAATDKAMPTELLASERPEVAAANMTLTAIRASLDERRELTAVGSPPTASPTGIVATETARLTAVLATATAEIAPANMTLTAIRATLDERRVLTAVGPSPTAMPTEILATATAEIAPANMTLTAIRATLDERRALTAVGPSPTASPTEIAATETAMPTEILATARPEVAAANLTLTAIRASLDERRELAAVAQSPTASPTGIVATETASPTEIFATARPEFAAANMTLTAIRATLDERRALTAAGPSPTASPTEIVATVTTSPTAILATARPEIAPANMTLTAIRASLEGRRVLTAVGPSPTASPTEIVATETASPTESVVTATQGAIATATEPPTKTELAPIVSPTLTPLPFYFAYLVPTPTAYRPLEDDFHIDCQVRQDWVPYEVREGDSLLSLALSSGTSLVELRDGNCFEPIRGIFAGETLVLPQLPELPFEVPAPDFSFDDAAGATVGCDDRSARIVEPAPREHVEDVFALIGSARLPDGGKYHIALKPSWSEEYFPYLASDHAVRNDVLGLINTEIFGAGAHRVRLTVLDNDGKLIEGGICEIQVLFGSQ